jgi:uncharacterized DUF497 family protein
MIKFKWDALKNKLNRKKHGVWFEEAEQVFDDSNAILYFDKDHSIAEDRFILLGLSATQLLVVIHCEVESGVIRIISARKATKNEKVAYEKRV